MIKTAVRMGMPVRIQVIDETALEKDIDEILKYFQHIDDVFSTYKSTSEISKINNGLIKEENASGEVKEVFDLCRKTEAETNGYFTVSINKKIDPSGIVKGYAIHNAAEILRKRGYKNFFVEIAGDAEVAGRNEKGELWKIGIQNPFSPEEIIKIVCISEKGIATSGNYIRGTHILNPISHQPADDIASMTVIGPNAYEADRFATAAFAMGEKGIQFIEGLKDFSGYMVTKDKKAIYTSNFEKYVLK